MDPTDFLATVAEVALGLAGFSGVMTAFMQRPGRLTDTEAYRIAVLLGASLGAMFLALVPLALLQFDFDRGRVWQGAAWAMIGYGAIAGTVYLRASRRVARHAPEIFNRVLFIALSIGHVVNLGLQLPGALALAQVESASGLYMVGLLWYLVHAAVQFGRLLFVQPAQR